MNIDIPGLGQIAIDHVVFDYNGTIARDGKLIPGVRQAIEKYSTLVNFHVITADTFGCVKKQLQGVNAVLTRISDHDQAQKKLDYINTLGPLHTLCAGNGANDELMLKKACIGIAVIGEEGLATASFMAADLMVQNILDVFGFFRTPERLVASLRT